MSDLTSPRKRRRADPDGTDDAPAAPPAHSAFSPRPPPRKKAGRRNSNGAMPFSPVSWSMQTADRRAETWWAERVPHEVLEHADEHAEWWGAAAERRDADVLEVVTRFGVPPARRRAIWLAWRRVAREAAALVVVGSRVARDPALVATESESGVVVTRLTNERV